MADSRFITFKTTSPTLTVTAMRGDPPQRTAGWGGWSIVPRPRRKSLTVFGGVDPLQQTVSVILGVRPGPSKSGGYADGAQAGLSAATDCNTLERMGRPPSDGAEPPVVRVAGAVAHTDIDWVINDLEWATDDNVIYSPAGFVMRQPVTVTLLEFVDADRVQQATAAAETLRLAATSTSPGSKPSPVRTYIVKSGDTLETIAAKLLGSYKRASDIGTLNGIRDGRRLTVGQRLRMPA